MSSFRIQHGYRTKISAPVPVEDAPPSHIKRQGRAIRRESRLTFGGFIYVGVTVFLAIGAINSQNNLLFWLFGVSIATLIVSGIFSGNALMKTRLRARALPEVVAGQPLHLHYAITNRSRFFPLFAALVSEVPQGRKHWGELQPASLVHIGPGQSGSVVGTFTPSRRGRLTLRKIRLTTRFPFGLLQKALVFDQPRTLLVLPHTLRLKPGLLRQHQAHGEQIRRRSSRAGKSNEFWGLREYKPGDSRRRISWKLSARRNGLVVIEHAQTSSARLWVWIIEPDADNEQWDMLTERAIAAAGALVEQGATRTVPVGLWYPQRNLRHEPSTGRAHLGRMLRALAMVDLEHERSGMPQPPMQARDQLIVVCAGEHPKSAMVPSRVLDVTRPESWLLDPHSLPRALGGDA